MNRFFEWLADRLRPWHHNGLSEELQHPEIPYETFHRGAMLRAAQIGVGSELTLGVFALLGLKYARRAARAWRPRELHLMEDVSLAFHEVEEYRERGLAIDAIRFQRLVETLSHYFACLGEVHTKTQVRDLVRRYLDEHSVPDPEPDPEAFFRVAVDLPLLDELHSIDAEMAERFPPNIGSAGLWDLGLGLDQELDASRSPHWTPINCRTFASTDGDRVHFSLLIRDGAINAESAVVLTVPLGGTFIVGRTLFDFLCLGCRRGYSGLAELAYDFDPTLAAYTNPESALELDEQQRQLLDFLTSRCDLEPWTDARRFHELQEKYGPELRLPPD